MRRLFIGILAIGAAFGLGACGTDAPSTAATARAAQVGVVDSVLPIEEALRRFREDLPEPAELGGGFTSRDSLVASFGHALFAADTATLATLLLDRAEFAYLYYPSTHFAREPYELDPAIVWFQIQNGTGKGITRALRTFGAKGHRYSGYRCEPRPVVRGDNRLWEGCLVEYRDSTGQHLSGRFFGSILERHGRFRFVSYTNPL